MLTWGGSRQGGPLGLTWVWKAAGKQLLSLMSGTEMLRHHPGCDTEAPSFYFSVKGKSRTADGWSGVPAIDSAGCPCHGHFAPPDSSPARSRAVLWGFISKSVLL